MTELWLMARLNGSMKRFFNLTMGLSVVGMAIGVGSLVVSMAVVSGYESTLEKTIQDVFGHVLVMKRGTGDAQEVLEEIKPHVRDMVAATPFAYVEAILAVKGQLNGVLIEGIDSETVQQVLNLQNRLIAGQLHVDEDPEEPTVLIGKGIAEKFKLQVGDTFRVVVPIAGELESAKFRPKLARLKIGGILNYGRFDFDSRYIVMSLKSAQNLAEIGSRITGYRVRLKDPQQARLVAEDLNGLEGQFWARDWFEVNRNLFEAVKLEKAVLFFVLLILVVVACFNVSSALYINVVQRYRDISVLKAVGATEKFIRRMFTWLGLMVGAVGALGGIGLGLFACLLFDWAQRHFTLIPKEVYKLDYISLDVRFLDLLLILVVSQLICFVATLLPAYRGSKVVPVEGLRYE